MDAVEHPANPDQRQEHSRHDFVQTCTSRGPGLVPRRCSIRTRSSCGQGLTGFTTAELTDLETNHLLFG
ncbi:hypothetical protein AAVH_23064 [Aphelenchoides avenae]|nr:hypothetical protein AAVH_23064 [Aphelenchus avenae]